MQKLIDFVASPKGLASVLGIFIVYALVYYFVFPVGGGGQMDMDSAKRVTLIMLGTQFAGTATLLAVIRALRDKRIFEVFYFLLIAFPLVNIASSALFFAEGGLRVDVKTLLGTYSQGQTFWLIMGVQVLIASAFMFYLYRREAR